MKPNFALDLSHDGIRLLHRAKGGWSLVGEVGLDDSELPEKLEMIRKTAADLESRGITAKLIIPNSQILYTTVTAPGPDDISREVQIRSSLEGLTPYPVGDLVFDWRLEGDGVKVAVLARETLDEAEGFARDHRMNPICFVARPEPGQFQGEPFFGKTKGASALLGPGEQVERDKKSVPVLATRTKPLPKPQSPQADESDPVEATARTPAQTSADTPPASEAAPADTPQSKPKAPDEGKESALTAALAALSTVPEPHAEGETPDPGPAEDFTPSSFSPFQAPTPPAETDDLGFLAPFPPPPDDTDEDAPKKPRAKRAPREKATRTEPPVKSKPKPTPPPPAEPAATPETASVPTPDTPTDETSSTPAGDSSGISAGEPLGEPADETKPPAPTFIARRGDADDAAKGVAPPSFSSRRDVGANVPPAPSAERAAMGESRIIRNPNTPAGADLPKPPAPLAGDTPPPKPTGPTPPRPSIGAKGAKHSDAPTKPSVAGVSKPAGGKGEGRKGFFGSTRSAQGDAPAFTPTKPTIPPKPAPSSASATAITAPPKQDETDAMTVFGARKSQDVGGKPRYLGLILILALLLFMAIVAVWSMYFLADTNTSRLSAPTQSEFSSVTAPEVTNTPLEPAPADTIDTAALAPADTPATSLSTSDFSDTMLADVEPEPGTQPAGDLPEVLSQDAAQARYAATGIWQKAPQPLGDPSGDRIDDLYVASIDPAITSQDAVALPPMTPQTRDPRPLAALPPLPAGTSFDFSDNGLVQATPEGTLTPDGIYVYSGKPPLVPPPRPRVETPDQNQSDIPNIRPKPRPATLQEDNERAQLGGITRAQLAQIRPRSRPASPQTSDDPDSAPTELALAASPIPHHRPSGFSAVVERARANASASDGSSVGAASAAPAGPQIPTRASVAAQATVENAINLRSLNLIGIYGSASARRALVRLPSGRYVKVAVGDRLNGGKVTAITGNKLVYQKSGRNHTLEVLPLG